MKRVICLLAVVLALISSHALAEQSSVSILKIIAGIPTLSREETHALLEEKLGTKMNEYFFAPEQSLFLSDKAVFGVADYCVMPCLEVDADAFAIEMYIFLAKSHAENFIASLEGNAGFLVDVSWTAEKSVEILPYLLNFGKETHSTFDDTQNWIAYISSSDEPV